MLSLLNSVQSGVLDRRTFVTAETTRRLYGLELSKYRDVEQAHVAGINALNVDPVEGRYLLSGGADGSIFIHDLQNYSGKPQVTYKVLCKIDKKSPYAHRFSVESIQWYPFDTGLFISAGMDHKVKVWDTNRLKPADEFSLNGKVYSHHMSPIATHHFLIAVASSASQVILVDLKSGARTHQLRGHSSKVLTVQWSPCAENLLASGGADNRILLWDIRSARGCLSSLDLHNNKASKQRSAHLGAINSLNFTSDGLFLVSLGTDQHMHLWDVAKSKNTLVNYGKIDNDSNRTVKLCVSPDTSPPLIFVPSEGSIIVFDAFSGMQISTLTGHFNLVNCCVLCPFTYTLFSGGNDRNILVWTSSADQEQCYEDFLHSSEETVGTTTTAKRNVTADAWSSDED